MSAPAAAVVGGQLVDDVRGDRHVVRRVEADEGQRDVEREDRRHRVRIRPHVPLDAIGGRRVAVRDVARGVDRAGHRVDAGEVRGERGIERRGVRDVRQRSQRDEGQRRVAGRREPREELGGGLVARGLLVHGRQLHAVERVRAGSPLGREPAAVRARVLAAAGDRHIGPAERGEDPPGVADARHAVHLARGRDGDATHVDGGVAEQDEQREQVVAREVRVDDHRQRMAGARQGDGGARRRRGFRE